MTTQLTLILDAPQKQHHLTFAAKRVYNLAFTTRDPALMKQHLDELISAGIPRLQVRQVPALYPVSDWAITTSVDVTVQSDKTSGEVEFVLLRHGGQILVGIGSDHTDRELEAFDILWSKQVCPNILAPTVWRLEDVEDHWDELLIESELEKDGERTLYQREFLKQLWPPRQVLASLEGRVSPVEEGVIVFSGTVPSMHKGFVHANNWLSG